MPVLVNGVATGATLGRSTTITGGKLHDTAVTWRATAEADLGSTALIYASLANGYRPGGTNSATGFETYRPEQLIAYTLGARWHDSRRIVTAAFEAFWWDYRDQHVTSLQPDLSTPPRNVSITRNIGRSRIRGFDLELDLNPAPLTVAFAKIEYLDARYLDNTFPQVSTTGAPLTGCSTTRQGTSTLYSVDCTSQRPFASPEWTLAFGLRQGFDIGAMRITAMARTRYVAAMMGGSAYLAEQLFPARWTSHAQLLLSDQSGRIELAAFVHNIEGTRVPSWTVFHPVSNALVTSTTPPRTYGLRAFARF
jgi:iron complex outermembrane receptor protein